MSSGTHSNLQSNTPPPRRGRRVARSREPTFGLNATSSEVPGILTGLLGSSPPPSRPESSLSSGRDDFSHPNPTLIHDHLPAVYNDETGDIPIGFDISHLMNPSRLLSAYSEKSGDIPTGFDTTHLVDRRRLIPGYSEASGDIPVAWVLLNPLAGAAAFRPRESQAPAGPNPYVPLEEIETELRDYPGTFQEWQQSRAEESYAEHRLRHQERLGEWREERSRRASDYSPLRGLGEPSDSHHAASDAEVQPRNATEDQSQSNELSDADRQRLVNWLRSRAQQRRAAREAQEEVDHPLARESSDPSSTNAWPSASTSPARDEAEPMAASSPNQGVPATSTTVQPSATTTTAAPFILPPEPEPHFLTSLNAYRYHLGTILLQPFSEEDFDEVEVRQMIIDADVHDYLRLLAYGRRQN